MKSIDVRGQRFQASRRQLLGAAASIAALGPFGAAFARGAGEGPIATTRTGKVRGLDRGGVASFRGIPYGAPPTGALRFGAPRPAAPWSGIRDCTRTGPRAIQPPGSLFYADFGDYFAGGQRGELGLTDQKDSEDCLVLNVLTPALDRRKRPVMVYIHGGGFHDGSGVIAVGAYRLPKEEDVVLVSVNHRLNVFGYLYLGHRDAALAASGNAGMLDLVLALEWVRDNIAAFGGDPRNVTIFGESGGGGKVSALLAMPAAKGLFHRAIVESGSMLQAGTRDRAAKSADRLLDALGISGNDLAGLIAMPARALFDASEKLGLNLGPIVDGVVLPRDPFAPDAPPGAAQVPMIIGYDEDETRLLIGRNDKSLFTMSEAQLPERLEKALHVSPDTTRELIAVYRNDFPALSPGDLFFRITSDRFGNASHIQAERKAAQPARVFKYFFKYHTPIPIEGVPGATLEAFHTAELPLVFRLVKFPETEQLSRRLASAWASFARTGDPSTPELHWPPYSIAKRETMVFDLETKLIDDPNRAERLAWKKIEPEGRLFG